MSKSPKKIKHLPETKIIRCPQCINIPSITFIHSNDGIGYIKYECKAGHNNTITLKNFLQYSKKFSTENCECKRCNKDSVNHKDIFLLFCNECKSPFCSDCKKYHLKKHETHILIPLYHFDSSCPIHGQTITFYCQDCKSNLCTFCLNEHQNHHLESLQKLIINHHELNEYKHFIKESKHYIEQFDLVINEILKNANNEKLMMTINKYKEENLDEITLANEIFDNYIIKESQKNLNYEIINNLRSVLKFNQIELLKNISKIENVLEKIKYIMDNINNESNYILCNTGGDFREMNLFPHKKKNTVEIEL